MTEREEMRLQDRMHEWKRKAIQMANRYGLCRAYLQTLVGRADPELRKESETWLRIIKRWERRERS